MPIQQQGQQHAFQPGKKGHKSRISSSSSRRLPLQASSWLLGNFYRYNKQQEMCLGFTLICYSNTSRYTKDDYVWLLFIIVSEIELSFVQSSILHLTRTAY